MGIDVVVTMPVSNGCRMVRTVTTQAAISIYRQWLSDTLQSPVKLADPWYANAA